MMDFALWAAQFAMLGALTVWMIIGVSGNWRHPKLNQDTVAMVARFELMQKDYPDVAQYLVHRRIQDPKLIRILFLAMRAWETLAALVLCVGLGAIGLAGLGLVEGETARAIAILGTVLFCLTWAGFLIGGEYFCYWYCHFSAQATHFFLLLWGLAVILLLIASP